MKIELKHVLPNPFRDIDTYPINSKKIIAIKDSILTTGFWDNLLIRRVSTTTASGVIHHKHEIAYGHHRLKALHALILEQVLDDGFELELPVRNLDDATMVRVMASESLMSASTSLEAFDHTVLQVRKFIVKECMVKVNEVSAYDICTFIGMTSPGERRIGMALTRLDGKIESVVEEAERDL